jgi:hypothetical protein
MTNFGGNDDRSVIANDDNTKLSGYLLDGFRIILEKEKTREIMTILLFSSVAVSRRQFDFVR